MAVMVTGTWHGLGLSAWCGAFSVNFRCILGDGMAKEPRRHEGVVPCQRGMRAPVSSSLPLLLAGNFTLTAHPSSILRTLLLDARRDKTIVFDWNPHSNFRHSVYFTRSPFHSGPVPGSVAGRPRTS